VKNHIHEWNTFTSWFIDWKVYLLFVVVIFVYLFLILFFLFVYIFSEIKFIKPLDDVKIQRNTITFTKDWRSRTVFINKMINSGIITMFIFFYNFYIYIFYFVSQVLCICTDNYSVFSMRNISSFFVMILFFFYLIIWWVMGIASESKLEVLKDDCFHHHNCFYYFSLSYLIILFYHYSNIPYSGE
jgi:MFS family permease